MFEKQESKQVRKIKEEMKAKCPFQPQINHIKKYEKQPQEGESTVAYERLFELSKKEKHDDKVFTFHPEINRNSQQIVGLMKDGGDFEQTGRWLSLYQYGTEKVQLRRELAKTIEAVQQNEEAQKYKFHPKIRNYSGYQPEADVVTRTTGWGESVQKKKEQMLKQYMDEQFGEENKELTFKPRLIAEEKLKRREKHQQTMNEESTLILRLDAEESHLARMSEGRYKREEADYIGNGHHYEGKLTVPVAPNFVPIQEIKGEPFSLEKVKCLTKEVIRNGEVVKDPEFQPIKRHEFNPMKEKYQTLVGNSANVNNIELRNHDGSLFNESSDFNTCVEDLHHQIQELFDA